MVLRQPPCSLAVLALVVASSPCLDKGLLHEHICLSFIPSSRVFLLLSGEQGVLAMNVVLSRMAQEGTWQHALELIATQQDLICALPWSACSVLLPSESQR